MAYTLIYDAIYCTCVYPLFGATGGAIMWCFVCALFVKTSVVERTESFTQGMNVNLTNRLPLLKIDPSSEILIIGNPSVFSLKKIRHEVHVANKDSPHKCSDGSIALRMYTPGVEERHEELETRILKCNSNFSLNSEPPLYTASVCHPFSGHLQNMPTVASIEQWVKYYLERGFQRVYWYVYDKKDIPKQIDGITWFVMPWLKNTSLHYGGQLTAMQHCLLWNKERKTKWTLYADVDEFLAVTKLYRQPKINLLEMALHLSPSEDTDKIAGYDFGEYRIRDFQDKLTGHENMTLMNRVNFDVNNIERSKNQAHLGHRKSLVRNEFVRTLNIHQISVVKDDLFVYHFHPWVMSLLHLRGLVLFKN